MPRMYFWNAFSILVDAPVCARQCGGQRDLLRSCTCQACAAAKARPAHWWRMLQYSMMTSNKLQTPQPVCSQCALLGPPLYINCSQSSMAKGDLSTDTISTPHSPAACALSGVRTGPVSCVMKALVAHGPHDFRMSDTHPLPELVRRHGF